MLPKRQKVPRRLFIEALTKGRSIHSKYLSLRFLKSKELKQSRFSFIVSSKVSKKATVRNLLKRRGYYIVRKNKKNISDQFIFLFFFSAKSGSAFGGKKTKTTDPFKELEREILTLFKKTGILKNL